MAKLYKGTPPVSFLDRIDLIFKDAYKSHDQSKVIETNTDSNGRPFTMERIFTGTDRYRYLLYRFDWAPGNVLFPFPYLKLTDHNNLKLGVAKSCDYVLFIERDTDAYIILIELKKGTETPLPQLEQMRYFVKFIQQRAYYAGIEIDAKIRMLGISDSVMKESTKMKSKINYDGNDFAQLYDGTYLRFGELAK